MRAVQLAAYFALLTTGISLPANTSAQVASVGEFRLDPNVTQPVQHLLQGPDGRMWFGDDMGLWTYDGYQVRRFEAAPGSQDPRPPGPVRSLLLDDRGRLWVGQWRSLVLIDPATDRVLRVYRHDPADASSLLDGDVVALHQDMDRQIWAGSLRWSDPAAGGLNRLDPEEERFDRYQQDPEDPASLSDNRIRSLAQDRDGRIWVGTWAGLNRLRPDREGFVRYDADPEDPLGLSYGDVIALHVGGEGILWVATIGGGLHRYVPETDSFRRVSSRGSPMLTGVVQDPSGRLWFGTFDGGLLVLDTDETLIRVDLGPDVENDVRVAGLTVSRDGVLWIAVLTSELGGGGLLRQDLDAPQVSVHRSANTLSLHQDDQGEVWLGSNHAILRWDPDTDSTRTFECPGLRISDGDTFASSIETDPDGTVWAGFWDLSVGLCRRRPGGQAFEAVRAGDPELVLVSDVALWGGGVWVAADGDLLRLDPESLEYEALWPPRATQAPSEGDRVSRVAIDQTGDLWAVTRNGDFARFNPSESEWDYFRGVMPGPPTRDRGLVTGLWPSSRHTFWVATGGYGLCAFDQTESGCVRFWSALDGLPADYVNSVLEDHRGRVWVTSRSGLGELDPVEGVARTLPRPVPLDDAQFREGAAALGQEGRLYFGTGLGALSFDPARVGGNSQPPLVQITNAWATGVEDVDLRPVDRIDREHDSEIVELASDLRDVTFEYVGLHYSEPSANTYAHRLDGLDREWRNVGRERRARYVNLTPGDYRFRVRAASQNGVWSDEASIQFKVLLPWWRRTWAWGLWATLTIAALGVGRTVRQRQLRMSEALRHERDTASRLRALSEARSRMFANLSHEYRAPLSLIQGLIEAVQVDHDPSPGRLEVAQRQTRELQRLTDELLDLAGVEAGALKLELRSEDLVPIVRRSVADFASAAEAADVRLHFGASTDSVRVMCDPIRMGQVVGNLVSNALKFTPSGGWTSVEVSIERHFGAQSALLAVEDSGVGIMPEAIPHVFNRFYRATATQLTSGGTGIGLAYVKEIVELHGGSVQVRSEGGRGSRFEVRIPLVDHPAPEGDTSAVEGWVGDAVHAAEPGSRSGDDQMGTLLIVEDHNDTRSFLARELAGPYAIETAPDGPSGAELALELIPDLVITDVSMPGFDGYELARRLRADLRTSHVPIIMLTGRVSEEAHIEGLSSGADAYVTKPYSTRILRSQIGSLLSLRRLLQERFASEVWRKPESGGSVQTPLDRQFLSSVVETIQDRMADDGLSVEELAHRFSMSRSQLHRKLKALTGYAPGSLIREVRLRRAAELIQEGGRSLSQVAYATGFADQAHFSRRFRDRFGCTPSEFRAEKKA